MRRFFIEKIELNDGLCVIPEKEAKHMAKVLRMKQGDSFILMDSHGSRFESIIEDISRHEVTARIIRELAKPESSSLSINICQAVLKPQKMDYMIEKTSELGVSRIIPFYSERTVIKMDEKQASNKIRRWTEISIGASKQSGRLAPAEIDIPVKFDNLLETLGKLGGFKVLLWEGEEYKSLKETLRSNKISENFTGIIGPEGGFTKKEAAMLKEAGIISVSLGSRILRAETAAIALTAVIQYEWGDLGV